MRHRRRPAAAAVCTLLASLAACGASSSTTGNASPTSASTTAATTGGTEAATTAAPATGSAGAKISLKDIAYMPPTVSVHAGQSVTWSFDDGSTTHTVTADDRSFDSGRKASGTFTKTFTKPGTFSFHCEVHPSMKGTITVTA